MSQTQVIQLTKKQRADLRLDLQKKLLSKQIPYADFIAKVGNTTITAYNSGKVVFQGSQAEELAAQWGAAAVPTQKQRKETVSQLPTGLSQLSVIGSDEVGNGSYFGPVTVCAAYVPADQVAALKALGVKDSKALTDPQIVQLATQLKQTIAYRLLIVTPEKYNQIQPKYNAVHMKVALHNQAIYLLLNDIQPVKPDAIVIDQFTPEANYKKYVKNEQRQVTEPLYFTTKGEQYHVAVAAASIISRAAFLEELDKESKELGYTVPSGAGQKADQVAAKVLKQGGLPLLQNYAKLHFANTEKAQKLAKR